MDIRYAERLAARFWPKVDRTGECWIWLASPDRKGYGQINVDGHPERAHRVAWFLEYGAWPELDVLHTCDVRRCVNIDKHLFLGTNDDNIQDMVQKGRSRRGEMIPWSPFTEQDVRDIRRYRSFELTYQSIADHYDVSIMTIHQICTYKSWRHIV